MNNIRKLRWLTLSICGTALFLFGCTASDRIGQLATAPYAVGPVYHPGESSVMGGKEAIEAMRIAISSKDAPAIRPLSLPDLIPLSNKRLLEAALRGVPGEHTFFYDEGERLLFISSPSVAVHDDRVELGPRIVFYFKHLRDLPIVVERASYAPAAVHTANSIISRDYDIFVDPLRQFRIKFPGHISFHFDEKPTATAFADILFSIKHSLGAERNLRMADFALRAEQYRISGAKPAMTEEQRKYIVQANVLNQAKDYRGAIELYLRAISVDPFSYPAAYSNLALLSAQTQDYQSAIDYMEQYLLLDPESKDSRSAKDKIYEWELMKTRTK